MPLITIRDADQFTASREFQDGLLIGRASDCDWPVQHPLVSKRHLQIEQSADGWRATDLGSTNGTWVAGGRITSHLLADGDVISVGGLELIFTIDPYPQLTQSADAARNDDATTLLKSPPEASSIKDDAADQGQVTSSPIPASSGTEALADAPAERLVGPVFDKSWETLLASPPAKPLPRSTSVGRPWDDWKKKLRTAKPRDRKLLALAAGLVIVAILSLYWGLGESEHTIRSQVGGASQGQAPSSANPASPADVPV